MLNTAAREHEWENDHGGQRRPDRQALWGEGALRLLAKPRPLQDVRLLGEVHLIAALHLAADTEYIYTVPVNGDGPILHLAIHEGMGRELHPSQQLVEVERRLQVKRQDVVPACALVAILHCRPHCA